ncbi:hypothetical protein K437DRAFT_240106 [Tilletiaria anomala UBC 951]|uniref:REM-1 domain-containing protein n=1 Tax=Tilletiaria anomala (strain ATCC 24038 / CBS 436.72 / UBC 951) TaxID=1037660 RepID=A0A066VIK0_TILAU|nr:uncharacterized protein K437DRAFT_240106 [Tilletiaria anomala UBC 951]KDN38380.1 hypothetical protein K437DRAFT_240106 [Tilletiaria anomala UBC 951]
MISNVSGNAREGAEPSSAPRHPYAAASNGFGGSNSSIGSLHPSSALGTGSEASATDAQELISKLEIELKVKDGAENLLLLLQAEGDSKAGLKVQVEAELQSAYSKIQALQSAIEDAQTRGQYAQPSQGDSFSYQGHEEIELSEDPASSAAIIDGIGYARSSTHKDHRYRHGASGALPDADVQTGSFGANLSISSQIGAPGGLGIVGISPPRDVLTEVQGTSGAPEATRIAKSQAEALFAMLKSLSQMDEDVTVQNARETGPAVTVQRRIRNAPGHIRTPSNAAGLGQKAKQRMDTMLRIVSLLRSNIRVRYEVDAAALVDAVLPCLSDPAGKEVRAHAYRTLRHAVVRPPKALCDAFRAKGLPLYLMHTLLRDHRFEQEREQALKLIRAIMEAGTSGSKVLHHTGSLQEYIDIGTVRALVAIAEQPDDKLRDICVETLGELALIDLEFLVRAGGLGPLLHSLTEHNTDLAPTLMRTLLSLLDAPATRSYLRPGVDLEVVISGFTDPPYRAYGTAEAGLRTTARVVSVMLRSWTGLIYLCMKDLHAIRSLVQALRINPNEACDVLLDMLYDLFNMNAGSETDEAFHALKRMSSFSPAALNHSEGKGWVAGDNSCKHNLIDHFLALVLMIFLEAGLLEALVHVIEYYPDLRRKATLLVGEVLSLSNRLLPPHIIPHIHTLPRLFTLASKAEDAGPASRDAASSALSLIDALSRNRVDGPSSAILSPVASTRADLRTIDKVRQRHLMQMDDIAFRNMIVETQVPVSKDHTKWHMEKLNDLLEGALLDPRRVEEAMKGSSRFFKRMLAFYHPFSLRYSHIRKSLQTSIITRMGCSMLGTIMNHPEGFRFLAEDPFLSQVAECLLQLDELNLTSTEEPLMTRARMEETLTGGYFEMISVFTRYAAGVELLEKFQLFSILHRLVTQSRRAYIVKAALQHMDLETDGHPRALLSHALTAGSRHLRLFATHRIAVLLRTSDAPSNWAIEMLLTQLFDPSRAVKEAAVKFIGQACQRQPLLDMVVSKRPSLDHLGDTGNPLLLKFLATTTGVRHLIEGGYVDQNMEDWYTECNHRYCVQLEVWLSQAVNIYRVRGRGGPVPFNGCAPPHFYGELVKTEAGCMALHDKGHFEEFAQFIQQHAFEAQDTEILGRLKSVLWAVGHIATAEGGLQFLEAHDLVSTIVEMAERSPVISIKGTCFFVLGLISTTEPGYELLSDFGWISARAAFHPSNGICLPTDLNRFVELPLWQPQSTFDLRYLRIKSPKSLVQHEILQTIANLGNSITANNASKALAKLKLRHSQQFRNPTLKARALELLSSFSFKQTVRKYIWDLFDLRLDEDSVRELQEAHAEIMTATVAPSEETQNIAIQPIANVLSAARGSVDESATGILTNHLHEDDNRNGDDGDAISDVQISNALSSVPRKPLEVGDDDESSVGSLPVQRLGPHSKREEPDLNIPPPDLEPRRRMVGGFA